jgi:tol-pal system protein YbgF
MERTEMRLGTAALLAATLAATIPVPSQAAPAHGPYLQVAGLFGESDEEKAAREAHESQQDADLSDLKTRVTDVEQSLQQTTGQNEQLSRQVRELKTALEKQKKDFDYKLCSLSAQLMGVTASGEGGLSCDGSGPSESMSAAVPATAAAPSAPGNPAASRKGYDNAMGMLARARYDEAAAAFRAFVDANPKDELAPQALFWLGSIAYVQKDYAGAASAFVENIKKFPKSARAPDSMLKLGQTLIALGQKKEGCLTLGAIKKKYPKAPALLLNQAAGTYSRSCGK